MLGYRFYVNQSSFFLWCQSTRKDILNFFKKALFRKICVTFWKLKKGIRNSDTIMVCWLMLTPFFCFQKCAILWLIFLFLYLFQISLILSHMLISLNFVQNWTCKKFYFPKMCDCDGFCDWKCEILRLIYWWLFLKWFISLNTFLGLLDK